MEFKREVLLTTYGSLITRNLIWPCYSALEMSQNPYIHILWHVDLLLGNDHETTN
jgi:hypothetical protein